MQNITLKECETILSTRDSFGMPCGSVSGISDAIDTALYAFSTIRKIWDLCNTDGLRGDGFEDEVVNAMNEFGYNVGEDWYI